jgi:hypothetical protein
VCVLGKKSDSWEAIGAALSDRHGIHKKLRVAIERERGGYSGAWSPSGGTMIYDVLLAA